MRLVLVLIALAIVAGVAELIARATLKEPAAIFPSYQTAYRYGEYELRGMRAAADFRHSSADGVWRFVTNDAGLRDARNFAYEKPRGVLRVLVLGDSHTLGYEVRQEATYAAVLERYLASRGAPAQVMNAGVAGFGTAEELVYLVAQGHRYKPDVVVLGFSSSDFADNRRSGLFTLDAKGRLVDASRAYAPGMGVQRVLYGLPPVRWLSQHSYLLSLIERRGAADPWGAQPAQEEIDLAVALVERVGRYCADHGMRLLVVDLPARSEASRFTSSLPERMRDALAGAAIEVVDSRALFEDYDGAAEFHVPHGENHLSELSHALIGVQLGRRIVRQAHKLQARLGQ